MPPDDPVLVVQAQRYKDYVDGLLYTAVNPPYFAPKPGQVFWAGQPATLASDEQVGGSHYREYSIQPVEYIVANSMGFLAGNVVKYVTRYKDKNGAEDIRKAIHYLKLILEFEYEETK